MAAERPNFNDVIERIVEEVRLEWDQENDPVELPNFYWGTFIEIAEQIEHDGGSLNGRDIVFPAIFLVGPWRERSGDVNYAYTVDAKIYIVNWSDENYSNEQRND